MKVVGGDQHKTWDTVIMVDLLLWSPRACYKCHRCVCCNGLLESYSAVFVDWECHFSWRLGWKHLPTKSISIYIYIYIYTQKFFSSCLLCCMKHCLFAHDATLRNKDTQKTGSEHLSFRNLNSSRNSHPPNVICTKD